MLSSYKLKVVDMHSREDLNLFKETAEATGIGLGWPSRRWSIELGSKIYKGLLASGGITEKEVKALYDDGCIH